MHARVEMVQNESEMVIAAMKKGMLQLLHLHTLLELKAICGGLNITVGEDGEDCIKSILGFVNEQNALLESRTAKVLMFVPETAVLEYLRHLGVPVHSFVQDPKLALRRYVSCT